MAKSDVFPRKELVYPTKQALVKNVVRIALHLLFDFFKLTGIDLKSLLGNVGPENKIQALALRQLGTTELF